MDLHYEVYGNGKPVVLIHSGGADMRDWSSVVPLLSEDFHVISFDGRGAGRSPSPIEPANYVQDLLSLLDHLNIPQAAVIGHSMGGQIATEFAIQYPERVSELILIAPALSGFPYSEEMQAYMLRVSAAAPDIEKMIELCIEPPSYEITRNHAERGLMIQMLRHHFEHTFTWATFDSVWPEPPAMERLEDISAKTLFIIGDHEMPDNRQVGEQFRRVPGARFVTISEADHMLTLTHPNELSRHIIQFVKD
ncbi:alpha/beta hydrolase fold protein [Paenibacillus vortex V453]|uniref:Alpha/beta hydrolase fold protein n=2 Tax=Paenibacillus TaxID=44249 RepID=A0A2R9SZW7_9BACL|nr:alpha/beta hydrolase [Paenibacillus vortex]EFU42942.1 alpha/beta hydrolase fold protein [Paenibacillus vortex V453]